MALGGKCQIKRRNGRGRFKHGEFELIYEVNGKRYDVCSRCWAEHCDEDNPFDIRKALTGRKSKRRRNIGWGWTGACLAVLLGGCDPIPVPTTALRSVNVTETKSLALLLFRDSAYDASQLRSSSQYGGMIADAAEIMETWSLGQLSLIGDVFGWFNVTSLASRSRQDLTAIARVAGFDPAAFDIRGWVLTSYSGGVAVVSNGTGDFTIGATYEGLGLILHETLHVMGLGHSNSCQDQAAFPFCDRREYGDVESIMGNGVWAQDLVTVPPVAYHRELLGWETVRSIDPVSGWYYFSLEEPIKFRRAGEDWFYVEHRPSGAHVCTIDPKDHRRTLWMPLPFRDPASGIQIEEAPGGVVVTWPKVGWEPVPRDGVYGPAETGWAES